MDILKVENLDVGYGSKLILKDLSLSFKENSITSIIGPSGCGKSTFLTTLRTASMALQVLSLLMQLSSLSLNSSRFSNDIIPGLSGDICYGLH